MRSNVDLGEFKNEFAHAGNESFSGEALGLIYDHMEQTNPDYVLDLNELCGAYAEEYSEGIAKLHSIDLAGCASEGAVLEAVLGWLRDRTTVFGVIQYRVVYCQF